MRIGFGATYLRMAARALAEADILPYLEARLRLAWVPLSLIPPATLLANLSQMPHLGQTAPLQALAKKRSELNLVGCH